MKKLRDIMRHGFLFTVQRGATVAEAARTMAANNVGIVAVLEGDRLVGGFSERDIVQKGVDRGLDPAPPPGAEGMTGRPRLAHARQGHPAAMRQMGQADNRPLPPLSARRA